MKSESLMPDSVGSLGCWKPSWFIKIVIFLIGILYSAVEITIRQPDSRLYELAFAEVNSAAKISPLAQVIDSLRVAINQFIGQIIEFLLRTGGRHGSASPTIPIFCV